MNQIIIHGRLTRDPEFKTLDSGRTLCNISVAVNRSHDQEKTDFFNCTAWGKTAEFIQKYFFKGKEIVISGRMESRSWETEGAEKRIAWDIQIERVDFCGKANDVERTAPAVSGSEQAGEQFYPIQDDDNLPF